MDIVFFVCAKMLQELRRTSKNALEDQSFYLPPPGFDRICGEPADIGSACLSAFGLLV